MSENWKQWEGRIVGKYRLERYLGGSDHSAVFLTEREAQPPQKAAIKLIAAKPETSESQLARWKRAGNLVHPHLLKLYDCGRHELDGVALLYVVLEYAEENLSQIIPVRALTGEEAKLMIEPALDALSYLKIQGLAHCGIKPSNILAANDELKISCDSIAKTGEVAASISPYSPPESADGILLPAGDLWSLGVVLVEVLTQRLPVWNRPAQSEPTVPPIMPAPFWDIARNCLRPDPQRRWTIAEIMDRLHKPVIAHTTAPDAKLLRPTLSKWRYLIPAGAIVLAAAVAIGLKDGKSPEKAEDTSSAKVEQKTQPQTESPAAKPKAGRPAPLVAREQNPAPAKVPVQTQPAAGELAPGVVHQVLPRVPQSARNTITGKIRVTVKLAVDEAGNVTSAALASAGPSPYFARLARDAARDWKFTPPRLNGRNVPSEWNVRFAFGRESTSASPTRLSPQ